jgi:hypothetical protein
MVVTMKTEKQSTALKLHTPNSASAAKSADQSLRPTTSKLSNRFEITVTGGIWCPECGDDVIACLAEALDDDGAMRHVCRCGHLIFSYERF